MGSEQTQQGAVEEAPEVPGTDPSASTEESSAGGQGEGNEGAKPGAPKPEDQRTSDFKELRRHNKDLAQALREQRELLESLTSRIPEPALPSVDSLRKPTLAMFGGDVEQYEKALEEYADAKHSIKAREARREEEARRARQGAEDGGLEVKFSQNLNLAARHLPDLPEVLERIKAEGVGEGIHDGVVRGIKSSPVSGEILHYLESNRAETARIEAMRDPRAQAAALQAIEGWIMRGNYRPSSKTSAGAAEDPSEAIPGINPPAPPVRTPPRPSGGGGTVTHAPTLATAKTQKDFLAAHREALRKR